MAANPSIQLGTDGNWAIKEDNLLAYKKDGTRFFNKEFDFTRNTTATFVDKNGLIKESNINTPRIDFTEDATGSLLLEPQSTNTATYSNDFTQGDIFVQSGNPSLTNSVLSTNQSTSPDGTNTANKLTDNNDGGIGEIALFYTSTHLTSGEASTVSMFVKKDTVRYFIIRYIGYDTSQDTSFDLDTGTVNRGTGVMTDYGGGWYRCSATFTTTTDLVGSIRLFITENASGTGGTTRNGTKSTFLWGLQAEEQSFATSYIPTSGSTVTRNADICNNSGSAQDFNSTEGVLYVEIAALGDTTDVRGITLSDGSSNNRVYIHFSSDTNIRGQIRVGASNQAVINSTQTLTNLNKIALKYKANDFALWINGVEVGTDTSGNTYSSNTLTELSFDDGGGGNDFYGNVRSVAVFKEALTDEQLQKLTT